MEGGGAGLVEIVLASKFMKRWNIADMTKFKLDQNIVTWLLIFVHFSCVYIVALPLRPRTLFVFVISILMCNFYVSTSRIKPKRLASITYKGGNREYLREEGLGRQWSSDAWRKCEIKWLYAEKLLWIEKNQLICSVKLIKQRYPIKIFYQDITLFFFHF